MNSLKKILFISDLHLDETHPTSYQQFKHLIENLDSSVDALYILGDFFETWVGDDNQHPFYDAIIELLQSVRTKNIPLFILHGNRDFLIGQQFLSQSGCTLLPDASRVSIYNTPVLLMHGDTLCTDDHAYQRARKLMRNKFLQYLFLRLPLSFRNKIADHLRKASKRHTGSAPMQSMDTKQNEVVRVMQKNQVRVLVHGHTHRPGIHHFNVEGEEYTRIVLGAWHDKASLLVWHENGEKELI